MKGMESRGFPLRMTEETIVFWDLPTGRQARRRSYGNPTTGINRIT
jgi:hypothetical protein